MKKFELCYGKKTQKQIQVERQKEETLQTKTESDKCKLKRAYWNGQRCQE